MIAAQRQNRRNQAERGGRQYERRCMATSSSRSASGNSP
jgi:hypothetical protein